MSSQIEKAGSDKNIKVLIADDHEMVRRGLVDIISFMDDVSLVGVAEDGANAVLLCQQKQPDVILMDLIMPVMDGIEAIKEIRGQYPFMNVIALSSFTDKSLVLSAFEAGAIGFLHKNVTMNELHSAIIRGSQGISVVSPVAAQYLINVSGAKHPVELELTPRESEVMKLIVNGKSNSAIARELSISLPTVKTHISKILKKFGVSSRAELIAKSHDSHNHLK